MQGGHNPYLPLDWYLGLLRYIKEHHPIHVHGFSASEIEMMTKVSKLPLDEVLRQLREAGLLTTATMMYGVGETWEDRLEHLVKLRASQERSLARGAGHYTAFIAWSFQPTYTEMEGWGTELGTGMDYLKMTSLSRLALDNFTNVQVSYVTQGPKMAQLALRFGANDFGSLMIEENVVSATGIDFIMPESEIRRLIEDAGFTPRRRYQDYTLAREGDEGCVCCEWREPAGAAV
jgi:cyclic dehypoxanthinyl futalosine synthase